MAVLDGGKVMNPLVLTGRGLRRVAGQIADPNCLLYLANAVERNHKTRFAKLVMLREGP